MATEQELVWCAGFFDGEGCIFVSKQIRRNRPSHGYGLHVSLTGVHKDSVDRIHRLIGCGSVYRRGRTVRAMGRQAWVWSCNGSTAKHALETLRPYLFTKASEADIGLAFAARVKTFFPKGGRTHESQAECEAFYQRLKQAKRYEWDRSGEPLHSTPNVA